MAHQFGVTVIAEGVETEADLQVLRAEGCDQMQGFLCTEALPADELAEFLVDLGDGNLVATTVSINQSA